MAPTTSGGTRVAVPHSRASVAMARHTFCDELAARGVPRSEQEDAVLVLSELLSNAITHAIPLPDGQIRIRWQVTPERLHMEITDGGALTRPSAGVAEVSSLGGRGLDIVRSVSSHWGFTEGRGTVTVWAELERRG
jgi:anti-sigma regulatory factor (Ser/Thr protein kinase)